MIQDSCISSKNICNSKKCITITEYIGGIQWLRGHNFALFWPPPTSTWIFWTTYHLFLSTLSLNAPILRLQRVFDILVCLENLTTQRFHEIFNWFKHVMDSWKENFENKVQSCWCLCNLWFCYKSILFSKRTIFEKRCKTTRILLKTY